MFPIEVVHHHLLHKDFLKCYKDWNFHGPRDLIENLSSQQMNTNEDLVNNEARVTHQDDIAGLLRDAFGVDIPPVVNESTNKPLEFSNESEHDIPENPHFFDEFHSKQSNQFSTP